MSFDQIVLDRISVDAGVSAKQTAATVDLLEQECTVPFIARYRKEVTANLDEVQVRTIAERLAFYKALLDRRATVLKTIEEQGKLTEDLKARICSCFERVELEDLYLPYKPKRKTKASVAVEKGLEPLARVLYDQVSQEQSVEQLAETFVNPERQVATKEEAIAGALFIVAEWISEDLGVRKLLRELFLQEGIVAAKVNPGVDSRKTKYEMYYDFREPVSKIPSHRMLAIRRGVKEQVLNFSIEVDSEKALKIVVDRVIKDSQSPFAAHVQVAAKDSYERLLGPSLQSEIRAVLKERSDAEAIRVFEANLSNLLLSPPAGLISVMGIDPGFRTGCKVALVDETGKFLEHTTIFPTEPRKDIAGSERKLYKLLQKHKVKAITIGNGTGSRETDAFVKTFVRKYRSGEPLGVPEIEVKKTHEAQGLPQPVGNSSGSTESNTSEAVSAPEAAAAKEDSQELEILVASADTAHDLRGDALNPAPSTDEARSNDVQMDAFRPELEQIRDTSAESAPARLVADATAPLTQEPTKESAEQNHLPAAKEGSELVEERHPVFSVIVNESGASVYSASESARQEFPKLDLTVRGAISIARRLQDPLAELVKIHPKAIGVGQYQHDVDQKRLKLGLEATVESCVNRVGVDLNSASLELLRYCSGVNQKLAKSIVDHRNQHGPFTSRSQLLQVPGFGEKTFEQAAGFLRIKGGENPLDATAVHPESYPVVERIAASLGLPVAELIENAAKVEGLNVADFVNEHTGMYTLKDIKQELLKPGRDPRDKFVVPAFRDDVKELSDLKVDMVLEGTVTNVTNFGAFVDIGVHQDGLVHVSELSSRFIQDPRDAVHVGEIVKVKVIGVDVGMKRISLSIKALLPERRKEKSKRKEGSPQPSRAPALPKAAEKVVQPSAARPPSHRPQQSKPIPEKTHGKPGSKFKKRLGSKPARKGETRPEVKPFVNAAVEGRDPEGADATVAPSSATLSFEEKIRLLQQKFGGIR